MPQLSTWNLDPTRPADSPRIGRRFGRFDAPGLAIGKHATQSRNCPPGLLLRPARLGDRSPTARRRCDRRVAPHLRLRCGTTKGGRSRRVPLWWDSGTLADLTAWKTRRVKDRARGHNPFVCSMQANRIGRRLQRHAIRRRFVSACKVLGLARLRTLTIHHGRHTFISHALAGGRSLAEVRVAAGHASLLTTSVYLHVAVDDDGEVGSLFEFHR
jgi:integrase